MGNEQSIAAVQSPDAATVKKIKEFYNSEQKRSETAKILRQLKMWWKKRKQQQFECESCFYQTDKEEKYNEHLKCHESQIFCKLCNRALLEVNSILNGTGVLFFFFMTTTITLNDFHEHPYSKFMHVNSVHTMTQTLYFLLLNVSIKDLWYILCGPEMRSKTDTGVEQSFHFCELNQDLDGYKFPIQKLYSL